MQEFVVDEQSIHYVARFLERWAEKAPSSRLHKKASEDMRKVSDFLIENLTGTKYLTVLRDKKKD